MGNSESLPNLRLMAVAREFSLDRHQIIALRYAMADFADRRGMVSRKEFDLALHHANLSDVEIFDLLFTMWDNEGVDKVPYKGFCVGLSPLSCPYDSITEILMFALFVSDDRNLGFIRPSDLRCLLNGINSTASFFGDSHLSTEEIDAVIESMFDGGIYKISHQDCLRRLVANPYVKRFASGKTRTSVQFKKELVTEIKIAANKKNILSPARMFDNRFQQKLSPKRQLWRPNNSFKRLSPLSSRTDRQKASLVDTVPSWETEENTKPIASDPPPTTSSQSSRAMRARQDPPTR